LDGFGKDRLFCKDCQESMLINDVVFAQKTMVQFVHPDIIERWRFYGDRKIGSLPNSR